MIILADAAGKPRRHAQAGWGQAFEPMAESLRRGVLPPCCAEARSMEGIYLVNDRTCVCARCPMAAHCARRSTLCIPLQHEGALHGYLVVAVDPALEIEAEEQSLFIEAAGDLAFALHGIGQAAAIQKSEEKRSVAEGQLRHSQKMEIVGHLAGGVAHDFNNLLTLINGYSRLLLDAMFPGDPNRSGLEEIHKAGERAAELTQRLLAFSRKQMLQPRVFDLNRVVTAMRSILTRVLGEDLELSVELSAEAATVRADPHQLEQVVMNLAVNARDAMAGGGRLRLETACLECDESYARLHPGARPGRYAVLAVSDTGTGMDEETRRHLFEPFFTTKEVGKGTGLGLAMVLGIVEQSGGFIEVSSELGRGTSFRIHLPMVEDEAADAEPPAAGPIAASRGTETVLVVEDQADVRKFAAGALRSYGYHVLQAENAFEAKLICESGLEGLELVLTDVVMPGLSGYELADWLAVHWPDIKVLFISGYAGDAMVRQAAPRKDAAFIQKPFNPSQLAIKVREVLGAPDGPAAAGEHAGAQ
jgi:signal transduction histidine kinase/ActR/RegA family two-component response regulator